MADPPKSVFLLARSLNVGGAERQLAYLAAGLHARGHEVRVGLFYTGGILESELQHHGISIVDLGKAGRWDIARFLQRVRRAIAEARPDVIYSFLGTANVVAAAVRPVSPPFRLVWSIRASDMDPRKYDWMFRLNYGVERALSRTADLIISNSHAGRDFAVAHGFPRERIEVVPNGIDTKRFRPDPSLRAKQRAEWGIDPDTIAIGVLARLDPMKDHATFLQAAAALSKNRPSLRFLCIGDGPEEGTLKGLAEQLAVAHRVAFTGRSTNPSAALNALDVACSSSSFGEGFSNSIAEAMACGISSVVTDVGDSARLVGNTGRVVPRRDPLALAAALSAAVQALGNDEGSRARTRIIEHFSLDAMVDGTLRLLRG